MISLPVHLLVWSLAWTANAQRDDGAEQSLILKGPQTASFCDSINLSWAGGQAPYTLFTILEDQSSTPIGDEINFYTTMDQTVDIAMNFGTY